MSKKKHGHHGGAWKVAYADFVTAMMALFLVLWLTSQDQHIRDAVERAFNHPFTSPTQMSTGIIPNDQIQAVKSKEGQNDSASKAELEILRRLNEDLVQSLEAGADEAAKNSVALEMTREGLRISVFDRSRRAVFDQDTSTLTAYGKWVLTTLAWHISRYPSFKIDVEGHTESGRSAPAGTDDWELTAKRANTARKALQDQGVVGSQIAKVVGFADTVPMANMPSTDEANRRVTVMLKVTQPTSF